MIGYIDVLIYFVRVLVDVDGVWILVLGIDVFFYLILFCDGVACFCQMLDTMLFCEILVDDLVGCYLLNLVACSFEVICEFVEVVLEVFGSEVVCAFFEEWSDGLEMVRIFLVEVLVY